MDPSDAASPAPAASAARQTFATRVGAILSMIGVSVGLGNFWRFPYLVGEFANAFVLAKLKIATRGRWLWTRTIGSTVVGQALDSVVFVTLAFAGAVPAGALIGIVAAQWLVKVVYEALATPLTYAAVAWLKAREQVDTFDYGTDFNPVRLRG